MKIVTSFILPDEECHGLFEGPRMMPMPRGQQVRWVQAVYVVRDDTIAEYVQDFGPAQEYGGIQPLLMPSMGENTVAQLQAHAEKNRHDTYWAGRREEMLAESTLIEDHLRQLEQRQVVIKRNPRTVKERRNGS